MKDKSKNHGLKRGSRVQVAQGFATVLGFKRNKNGSIRVRVDHRSVDEFYRFSDILRVF
jgi:hypothetical protein